ncbi:MAG: hypothetical protein MK554_07855 [Planctomycetes bacterium]|nr:hypothetical protein [Planctomycetota bacterium]
MRSRRVVHPAALQGQHKLEVFSRVEDHICISNEIIVAGPGQAPGVSPGLEIAEIARSASQQGGGVFGEGEVVFKS